MEMRLLYMSEKTYCVVFQNSKLTSTFDQFLYLRHYIQGYKVMVWTKIEKGEIQYNVHLYTVVLENDSPDNSIQKVMQENKILCNNSSI